MQKLQHALAASVDTPAGCEGDLRALDDSILLAVVLDLQLMSLVNSIHAFIGRTEQMGGAEGEAEMKLESELRVRKCLRLVA